MQPLRALYRRHAVRWLYGPRPVIGHELHRGTAHILAFYRAQHPLYPRR